MTKAVKAILTRQRRISWPPTDEVERLEVVVLAVVGINAMVRRPGCAPFVADSRQLNYDVDGADR